jgi:AraC-like DNA-binding protein
MRHLRQIRRRIMEMAVEKSEPVIRSPLVQVLLGRLRSPAQLHAMRMRHGISLHQLANPLEGVALARYVALFEDIAAARGDGCLGARLGALQSPADSLGPLGFLFLAAPTLREGLLHVTKYIGTWQTGTFIGLQAAGGAALRSYRIETPEIWPRRQDAEYTMMTMCTMIRARFGQNWRPQEIHFEHEAPAESGVLRTLFGAPLKFRQPYNALVLEARALDLAGKSAFECFVPNIERYVHELQMAVEAPADMVTQVRGLVRQGLGHSEISLAWVAQTLGLSPRSLQRHLAASGTSLREIVQEIRSREAMNLLGSATQLQAGVAQALGYTDNTAFWRAFKSWAGVSPRDYKRKASSPGSGKRRGRPE